MPLSKRPQSVKDDHGKFRPQTQYSGICKRKRGNFTGAFFSRQFVNAREYHHKDLVTFSAIYNN
jgi:hypothetical protein